MVMSVLYKRCIHRARLADQLLEDWEIDSRDAEFAKDVDEFVNEMLELEKLLRHAWSILVGRLFSEQIDNIEKEKGVFSMALDLTLAVFDKVASNVERAHMKGYAVEGSDDFAIALNNLRSLKTEVGETLPSANRKMMEAAMAAYKRGEYQSAEDLM
jgi:hypothetical protein